MQRITPLVLLLFALLLTVQAAFSLGWPIAHDEAPLFYETFLMQNGAMPYRDFFDFQMPGSYIVYYLLGLFSSFGPLRIRILDLLILSAILFITYFALKQFGKTPALAAGILFGLKYLGGGPALSLQREYLILIFLSLAIFIALQDSLTFKHRLFIGLLVGLATTIKPHSAIGLVPILLFDIFPLHDSSWFKKISFYSIGFSIPIVLIVIWLASTNALTPFLDIALNYWGLYSQINGELVILPSVERISYILNLVWRLGGHGLWLIPAAFAVYLNKNRKTYLLAGLALCYAIYPAFTGQFFPYHYILFIYFIIILASLSIIYYPSSITKLSSFLFLLTILINVRPSQTFMRQIEGRQIVTSSDRGVEIANFLKENLEEGDLIQPLDWTGGSLLAMLETRAQIATEYIFDFYFYHHVSEPYIQSLRIDFMNQLDESMPRFVVEVTSADKPWVGGPDTSRTKFPELQTFLDENYSITIEKEDYVIYELK